MALDAGILGGLIRDALEAGPYDPESGLNAVGIAEGGNNALVELCDRLAAAVVEHITAEAVVTVEVPAEGLLAGGQPVEGAATGVGGVS